MTIRQHLLAFGTLAALTSTAPLAAQGIAIRASTLGIGGELSFRGEPGERSPKD